eukprot:NODE_55_length_29507_cov_0.809712.p4 type:complete len:557 gc:universal NODE_55_length_29507_cov_0.809712:5398-7068(+)
MQFEDIGNFKKDAMHREILTLRDEIRILSDSRSLSDVEKENISLHKRVRQLQSTYYQKIYGLEEKKLEAPLEESKQSSEPVENSQNKTGTFDVDVVKLKADLAYYMKLWESTKESYVITYAQHTEFSFKKEYEELSLKFETLQKLYDEKPKVEPKVLPYDFKEKELIALNEGLARIRNTRDAYKKQIDELKANYAATTSQLDDAKNLINDLKDKHNQLQSQFITSQMILNKDDEKKFAYWSQRKENANIDVMDVDNTNFQSIQCVHELWLKELQDINIPSNEIAHNVEELLRKYASLAKIHERMSEDYHTMQKGHNNLESATSQMYDQFVKAQTQNSELTQKYRKLQGKLEQVQKQKDNIKNAQIASDAKHKELSMINKLLNEKVALLESNILELKSTINELSRNYRSNESFDKYIFDKLKIEKEELDMKLITNLTNLDGAKRDYLKALSTIKKLESSLKAEKDRYKIIKSNIEESGGNFDYFQNVQGKEALETLEYYEKLLKCTACHINFKSHIMTKCYHMFCEECIQQRIDTRQRKCPQCTDSFGINDYLPIYF